MDVPRGGPVSGTGRDVFFYPRRGDVNRRFLLPRLHIRPVRRRPPARRSTTTYYSVTRPTRRLETINRRSGAYLPLDRLVL